MTVVFKVVMNKIPELNSRAHMLASQAVRTTARYIETTAKDSMSGPKSGRLYNRGGKIHRASAPGESPAVDIGNLASSIQTYTETPLKSLVATDVEYSVHLEYGTVHIKERPFFKPAAKKAVPIFEKLMAGIYK